MLFGTCLLLIQLHFWTTAGSKLVSLVLPDDDVTNKWRLDAGHPIEKFIDQKSKVVWTLHERVGIGNTLGGFNQALQTSMVEERALVIHSRILSKFCDMVHCSLVQLPHGLDN
jgi:hypothetical protein